MLSSTDATTYAARIALALILTSCGVASTPNAAATGAAPARPSQATPSRARPPVQRDAGVGPVDASPAAKAPDWAPFEHIEGIWPGKSRLSDGVQRFGAPVGERRSATGTRVVRFEGGISIVIDAQLADEDDPPVDAIYAEPPYDGISAEGLRLGITEAEAIQILDRLYVRTETLSHSLLYGQTSESEEEGEDDLQVWFDQGVLSRIKVFR